jgi:hypothetical protein
MSLTLCLRVGERRCARQKKNSGGWGLKNLEFQNMAMLMCWWWRAHKEPDSLLADILKRLHSSSSFSNGPPLWTKKVFFFSGRSYT